MTRPTEAQRKQWQDQGYLVLAGAIEGDELQRLQRAFDRWAEVCKLQWLDQIEAGEEAASYYDIPDILEKDEIFIELVDHPSFYWILKEFMDGPMLLLEAQARLVPPWPISYLSWHCDAQPGNPLHIKVQIYLSGVEPGGGEFGYVPGSHKPNAGPYPRVYRLESMPGHKRFPGKAGDAILFNGCGQHTAMDNHSDQPKKSIILIYEQSTPGRLDPKTYASISHCCSTRERRQLFGLEP